MIGVLYRKGHDAAAQPQPHICAGALVLAALRRSVTRGQALPIALGQLDSVSIVVAVDVPDHWGVHLLAWWKQSPARKLLVFGAVPCQLRDAFGWTVREVPIDMARLSRSASAPSNQFSESDAVVRYGDRASLLGGGGWIRPFERFDFTDEWNNLGYGAIRGDDSIWSLATATDAGADELAAVCVGSERQMSYAALADEGAKSLLWVNRRVGSIDSFEWRLIENFLSEHRHEVLPCQPIVREIPLGYDAMVTSRLDCDEDIESARPLWDAYRALKVPFSLAVHSKNLTDPAQHAILRELAQFGNPLLSHTATHAPNWGGSYGAAYGEATASANAIRDVTGIPVTYAVSPFHQTPHYALQALADAGYTGCIGGIIRNDPDFVLARGGEIAGLPSGFIGHSQQCMLHGECMLTDGDPLRIFKQAFDQALQTATLFGYLDHPFSSRYAYGWSDETSRIQAHRDLIAYIRERSSRTAFVDEIVAMSFLQRKARTQIRSTRTGFDCWVGEDRYDDSSFYALSIDYKGEILAAADLKGRA